MRKLLVVALATALAGCAEMPQQQGYGTNAYAQPRDPSQWRVVSVTPVPVGTAAKVAAKSPDGKPVEYSSTTVPRPVYSSAPIFSQTPVYSQAPVYGSAPVYYPAPVYAPQPSYYWPPVSLSLGFVLGQHWGRGYGGGHFRGGHFRGGHR
ncbi:hypothetical protein [Massilia sp. TWP1-3-3]|uniref:hypothetical protein n=1 Tax=Massilia sp. TWP1-3-3 TaxID=2804573 RepID=UPI003CE761A7